MNQLLCSTCKKPIKLHTFEQLKSCSDRLLDNVIKISKMPHDWVEMKKDIEEIARKIKEQKKEKEYMEDIILYCEKFEKENTK